MNVSLLPVFLVGLAGSVHCAGMCGGIVVLADGGIAETGTHTELLEKNGVYANLYHLQFAKETEA